MKRSKERRKQRSKSNPNQKVVVREKKMLSKRSPSKLRKAKKTMLVFSMKKKKIFSTRGGDQVVGYSHKYLVEEAVLAKASLLLKNCFALRLKSTKGS